MAATLAAGMTPVDLMNSHLAFYMFTLGCALTQRSTRSEERRVGKECRSRCDWSSDVCSSDLHGRDARRWHDTCRPDEFSSGVLHVHPGMRADAAEHQIGRASCRERV